MINKVGKTTRLALALTALGLSACGEAQEVILPGERLDLRVGQTPEVSENVTAPIALGTAVARSNWSHAGGSATHNAGHNAFTSTTPIVLWTQNIGEGNSRKHRITSAPVAAQGLVVAFDAQSRVTAISGSSSAVVWSKELTPAIENADEASGGSLAISGDTLLASTGFGEVVALDLKTGAERWRQDIDAVGASGITVHDGLAYVMGGDAQLWAISISDGRVAWQIAGFDTEASRVGAAAPAVNDRLAVLPFASGDVFGVFRKGGTQLWSTSLAGQRAGYVYANVSDITSDPVIVGDTVYVGNQSGRFGAFDMATGAREWTANEGAYSLASVIGGSVFFLTDRAELVRLNANSGARIWGVQLGLFTEEKEKKRKAVYAHYGPVAAGGKLWVASSDGLLRGYAPESGILQVQLSLPAPAASDPIVVGGVMYVLLEDGTLAALK